MNIAEITVFAFFVGSTLAGDFIPPGNVKGNPAPTTDGGSVSEAEAGKPLEPDDFIRGRQTLAGDVYRRTEDPTAEGTFFEGDIDLRGLPVEAFVDKVTDDSPYGLVGDIAHNAIRGQYFLWPDARVPYLIHRTFNAFERGKIAAAVEEYNKKTCIRWVPKQRNDKNYVYIIRDKGCYSTIGKAGGRQNLSLGKGCIKKGIIMHEMMHAAGFWHEQSRNDRDNYVTIKWDNIQGWARGNFKKLSLKQIDHLGAYYDYGSIMHYGRDFFSSNGRDTIVPKGNHNIGNRKGFSETDVFKLNKLYNCRPKRITTGPVIITDPPRPVVVTRRPRPVVVTPRPRPVNKVCEDRNPHCDMWLELGLCPSGKFVQEQCQKSCGRCRGGPGPKPVVSAGRDSHDFCGFWLDVGECGNPGLRNFMKQNCPKTCSMC